MSRRVRHLQRLLPVLLLISATAQASRWVELGTAGVTTDKVLLDLDSVRKLDDYRLADVMTLYGTPHEVPGHITYDREVRKFAFDCAAQLGESIGVIGYPLSGLLSAEPKATFGQVNSVAGVNNDYTLLQISAPIQPGNSGGPVLDQAGEVIGIVVSEAAILPIVAAAGVAPENINFAVRGEVAQIFLSARGIKVRTASRAHSLSTEALAAAGLKSTVFIQCQND